jgi:hypothetical protein
MKKIKILMIFCLSMIALISKSQTTKTFEVIGNGVPNISVYESTIAEANLESYRNKTTRDTLVFESGVQVILYSAQELYITGYSIDPSQYVDVRDPRYTSPTFRLIIPNGMPQVPGQKPYLVALYNHIEK